MNIWGAALTLLVSTYMGEASCPGVAVAITKGDQVIAVQGFGHDSTGAPMTENTKMAIASVSKSFTALAVRQLADAGKIDLDRPVFDSRVTARQLLAHKSGISDRTLPEKSLKQPGSPAEAVERAREALQKAVPDNEFRYTNTNYHLAARLVELASGENFNAYLKKHVFEPLGMRDTVAIDVTPRDLPADYRKGYGYAYGFSIPLTEPDRFVTGSDGVITTAADMAKWLAAQPKLAPQDGMGWEADQQGRLRHNGIWFTSTAGQLLTESGYGIAVMANSGITLGNEGTYGLENGIADVVDGKTPPEPESYRLLIDLVLAALTLLSTALGIRALKRPRRFHKAWQVLRFVPLGVLLALPTLLGLLYGGGRDITFFQLAHYSLPLVVWLGVSSVMNLSVAVARWRR
ncbi:CubicO group peptidase, beta-lactamase class C family [Lentzea waywayandensis]|uniref:CubicO group peptidase, beta-lactamase class C family n=1 Tax=Lentzea waywayandensis TaxID=84724 RepID=A0A1I6FIQ9_9PSEU|nr:serine hydrolase domain-containing protein [Lentzea waywayandensis]SFR29697.1 CubicO group peptidase, beta-lactamase class C family [Lentzea waywayandensis]